MIDQIALNVAIYERGVREVRLPATSNWIAHLATPAWHSGKSAFVEPDPPFEVIGILHLTLSTKWAPSVEVPLVGADAKSMGQPLAKSLRFPG
jgi:hypothetical protein